jgi:hypothetical protein
VDKQAEVPLTVIGFFQGGEGRSSAPAADPSAAEIEAAAALRRHSAA